MKTRARRSAAGLRNFRRVRRPTLPVTTRSPLRKVPEKRAADGGVRAGFHDDDAIHALVAHREPFAGDADLRGVNGRGVKVVRGHAIHGGGRERGVLLLGGDALCAEGKELADDAVEPGVRGSDDAHLGAGDAGLLLAEIEVEDLEGAAVLDGDIDGFFEQSGVEQMPLERDDALADAGGCAAIGRGVIGELQDEAFRGAAGFHELVERRLDDIESRPGRAAP